MKAKFGAVHVGGIKGKGGWAEIDGAGIHSFNSPGIGGTDHGLSESSPKS
jgi:hypothetical protein